ncbi:MAG: bifunctional UDP-N-acetylglucosamine diphosphorylase/glucosamine-1-phosphate N-acetyltransferase GlmU [Caldilineaceae bacterium]
MNLSVIILAAGYGTRMKSDIPKFLHPIAGRSMVEWAVRAGELATDELPVVVVGHGSEHVMAHLGERVQYAMQDQQLGTAHAAMQAQSVLIGQSDAVIVIYADMPLLRGETLRDLADLFMRERAQSDVAMAMLTIVRDDAQGFGRIVRNQEGHIQAIVEEAVCTPEQRNIRELNPGVYCFDATWLWDNLPKVTASPKGEYYLTDMVEIAVSQGCRVVSMFADLAEVDGVNTRVQLAQAEVAMRKRIADRHMLAGVTILDPSATYIDDDVEIGQDTTILPGCLLQGTTKIGAHCMIGPHSRIIDSKIGDHCMITYSVLESASVANHCEIGPFGRLRKGAQLDDHVHMGNFGEIKNSYLGPGTKMGHFSYVGDAEIEGQVNIGAGTITVNYDGQNKHKTTIGQGAFIGSDTLLVAPVNVGRGAKTGAGSVVTHDIPDDTLVYGVPARPAKRR